MYFLHESHCFPFWSGKISYVLLRIGFKFRKVKSQEGLEVHLQGWAGHGQLEAADDVWVEDPETPYALPRDKDLCTATGEEGGI